MVNVNPSMVFFNPLRILEVAVTSVRGYFNPSFIIVNNRDYHTARCFDDDPPSPGSSSDSSNGIFTEDDLIKEPNPWLDYEAMERSKTMTYAAMSLAQEQTLEELLHRHIVNASERARNAFNRLQERIYAWPPNEASYTLLDVMDERLVAQCIRKTVEYNGIHVVAAFDRLQSKGKFFLGWVEWIWILVIGYGVCVSFPFLLPPSPFPLPPPFSFCLFLFLYFLNQAA